MKAIITIVLAVLFLGTTAFATPKNGKHKKLATASETARTHRVTAAAKAKTYEAKIRKIQAALGVKVDGIRGKNTTAAIKRTQIGNDLKPTGRLTTATLNAIFFGTKKAKIRDANLSHKAEKVVKKSAEIAKMKVVSQSVPSHSILKVERSLTRLGFPNSQNDSLDDSTKEAIEAWRRNGQFLWFNPRGKKGEYTQKQFYKISEQEAVKKEENPKKSFRAGAVLREKTTKATVFGHVKGRKDTQDSGRATPLLNPDGPHCGLFTAYPTCEGAALPIKIVAKEFGIKPRGYRKSERPIWNWDDFAPARMAGVEIYSYITRKWYPPTFLKDFGPGEGPQARGVELDVCAGTNRQIGGDGMTQVRYRLIANCFPERAGKRIAFKTTKPRKLFASMR